VLISDAYAQAAAAPAAGGPMEGLLGMAPIILMFIVLWFLMIRPQMKKAKEHQKMVSELQKGDEVVSQGGIAGRVVKIGENFVSVEVSSVKDASVEVVVQKQAISAVLPKGTLKSL
jgi:preprotein translocase subunit YajC